MISLIYVSSAVREMSHDDLLEILRVSRRNNGVNNINGLLLYKGGNFMQVLEGSEAAVTALYETIQMDVRHKDVMLVSSEKIQTRQFSTWEMGFQNLDEPALKHEAGLSRFLEDEFTAQKYRSDPSLAHIMLLTFRDNMR